MPHSQSRTWSPQQDAALRDIRRWMCDPDAPQTFYLAGYAGTGKTTLAREIAGNRAGEVLFCAFTGKAAQVLRQKGCDGASTIHSLIYKLTDELSGVPTFELNEDSKVRSASLVILDECSMVDHDLAVDLLSFGTPILVLGDPAQLPPVKGAGYFTSAEPDLMLTEIHRQARDNPIIHMSMVVREGGKLARGSYGDSRVMGSREIGQDEVLGADQVLVGRNVTRTSTNTAFRELQGRGGIFPNDGEKLVCLKNKREKNLLNGSMWTVKSVDTLRLDKSVGLKLKSEDMDDEAKVVVRREFFTGEEEKMEWFERKKSDEFTFGYALTVHKSQGSQWNNVVLFDESVYFRENRAKHLYTALTRAAERITVVM